MVHPCLALIDLCNSLSGSDLNASSSGSHLNASFPGLRLDASSPGPHRAVHLRRRRPSSGRRTAACQRASRSCAPPPPSLRPKTLRAQRRSCRGCGWSSTTSGSAPRARRPRAAPRRAHPSALARCIGLVFTTAVLDFRAPSHGGLFFENATFHQIPLAAPTAALRSPEPSEAGLNSAVGPRPRGRRLRGSEGREPSFVK